MNLSQTEHIEFLKSISVFQDLNENELNSLTKTLFTKEIKENELVFSRLEKEQVLYIVRYGKLKLEMIGREDRIYGKGDVFGEIALINNHYRTGTIKAIEPSLLVCLTGNDLMDNNKIPATISIKIVKGMANIIASYLATVENTSTQKLIELGENEHVEFKSTLRYNLFTKKPDKEIEHAALKSITAFLNSSGGTLIIGVDDNKNILGIENDKFQDDDRMLLHLTKLIQHRIGIQHTRFVNAAIENSNGSKILRIDVKPASSPAYIIHNNDEVFYIRTGPSTSQMKVSEIYDYIQARFI